MGLFDWLIQSKSKPKCATALGHPSSQQLKADWDEETISIPSRNFHGTCCSSPNKRYRLAWEGGSSEGADDGRYLLLDGNAIIVEGKMARPVDGKVADNGVFILNDGLVNRSSGYLLGAFCAFDATGKNIIRRIFKALLSHNTLSADGRLAACNTANSDDDNDSAILTVFDLVGGIEIAQWRPESGWPSSYEFSPDGKTIGLASPHLGIFRYSIGGDFIDREVWQDTCLFKGEYWDALGMTERLITDADEKLSAELATKLILAIDRVMPAIAQSDVKTQARALKCRGMCLEAQGSMHDALNCYDKALALEPKIGIKRRANQLRKVLG